MMTQVPDRGLLESIVRAKRFGAFDDEVGRRVLRAFEIDPGTPWLRSLVQDRLHALERRTLKGEIPPFARPRLPESAELILGYSLDGKPLHYDLHWLASGVLCVGNTGAAKTSLMLWLCVQVILRGGRVLLTDLYKRHMRHIGGILQRVGQPLVILDSRRWKWNLLQASKLDPTGYFPMAVDLLTRILNLPGRARSILFQVCWRLYDRFGIWRGQDEEWPCLFDVYEEVVRLGPSVNAAAREAILDRLGAFLTTATPKCAAYRLAWDPVDLSRCSIVLELRSASETLKQALVQPLLFSLMQHRIQSGAPNRNLELVLALDDAQRYTIDRGRDGELDPLSEAAGIIRGGGTGLYCNVQTMHGVTPRLPANLATKISGRLGAGTDGKRVASDLGMTAEQLRWATIHQTTGTFVATVPGWREPFLFQIPRYDLPPVVSDDQAQQSVHLLDGLPVKPAPEFENWQPSHLIQLSGEPANGPSLSEAEIRFLRAVVDDPQQNAGFYSRRLGMSGSRATTIRRKLARLGLIQESRIATSGRGRSSIIIDPLEPAHDALGQTD